MKKVIMILISVVIMLTFSLCVYADSPITSTEISAAYMDNEMVKSAAASKVINTEIAQFLNSDDNPIDVKAAVINALGWGSDKRNNAEIYSNLVLKKSIKNLNLEELSGNDLFCIGYLRALDNYFDPQKAIPILEKANSKLTGSLTVSIITAVVKAQDALLNGKLYSTWNLVEQVQNDKLLKQDMRAEAVKIITDYMQLYSKYFELDSRVIQVETGKSVTSNIIGNSGPYKFEGAQILEKDNMPLYMGAQINGNVFSPNAKADITVSGDTVTFKGIASGTIMASFSNKYGETIIIPVAITLPDLRQRLNNAIVLCIGSSSAFINNSIVQVDTTNPGVGPIIMNERTLVPVRFVSEKFGANVKWDDSTSTATITTKDKVIKITARSSKMIVNGNEIVLDVPAEVIQNRLFIPLRKLVEEVLDKKVFYERGLIIISDNESIMDKYAEEDSINDLIRYLEKDISDIQQNGGMRAIIRAVKIEDEMPTEMELQNIKSIIERRLDNVGVWGRRIFVDKVNGDITLEVSAKYASQYFNNKESLKTLIHTDKLTFQEIDEELKDENGRYLPTNKIVIDSNDVKKAQVELSEQNGGVVVALSLSNEGAVKFEEATGRLIGKPIGIFIGTRLIQAPIVLAQITGGNAIITGQKDAKAANELANDITLGAMNVRLNIEEYKLFEP